MYERWLFAVDTLGYRKGFISLGWDGAGLGLAADLPTVFAILKLALDEIQATEYETFGEVAHPAAE